jgi:D-alanine-D-alanine ligase
LGNEYILEVNTLPGLTPQSLLPKIDMHSGMTFSDLIEAILMDAKLRASGTLDDGERRVRQRPFVGPEQRTSISIGPH